MSSKTDARNKAKAVIETECSISGQELFSACRTLTRLKGSARGVVAWPAVSPDERETATHRENACDPQTPLRGLELRRAAGFTWVKFAGGSRPAQVSLRRMKSAVKRDAAKGKARKNALGRDAWLQAARAALIRDGIGGVEIGKLARRLRATRGGFYWFFTSRKQLLDQILADWEQANMAKFKALVADPGANGMAEFRALVDIWINEDGYDPQWDAAVREWARISPRVAGVVHRVDDARIAILQQIFEDMGYEETEAFVRARIAYFHQVGYYTLGVQESRERRLQLLPLYIRQLTGLEP